MVYNGIVIGLISAILAAIVSFGAGATKLGNIAQPSQTQPIVTSTNTACYNPQLNVKLTLKYPENFTNVTDQRSVFNPKLFASNTLQTAGINVIPQAASSVPTFNSDSICSNLVMSDKATRNYILVREDVRISSCKTDELAGPLGKGSCPGFEDTSTAQAASQRHRGTCDINGYTDLRKIADVQKEGKTLEIFWNPFSLVAGADLDAMYKSSAI